MKARILRAKTSRRQRYKMLLAFASPPTAQAQSRVATAAFFSATRSDKLSDLDLSANNQNCF